MNGDRSALEEVYAAGSAEELSSAYARWSCDYDRETIELGYCLPFVAPAWLARHVPAGAGPILDAGCGTGLSGPYLRALGYSTIEGLDFSDEMLGLARQRNVYRVLKRATLGESLPWADGHFAAFLSTGVFTEGHAPASSLEELVRITRPGGHAVFTVRESVLVQGGFLAVFDRLEKDGSWRRKEESEPFRAFAIAEPEVLVQAFVFEIL
jgi:SAM-dependent methyltransferase